MQSIRLIFLFRWKRTKKNYRENKGVFSISFFGFSHVSINTIFKNINRKKKLNKTSSNVSSNFCLCKKILPHLSQAFLYYSLENNLLSAHYMRGQHYFVEMVWWRNMATTFFPLHTNLFYHHFILRFFCFLFFLSLSSFPIAFIITIRRKEKKILKHYFDRKEMLTQRNEQKQNKINERSIIFVLKTRV